VNAVDTKAGWFPFLFYSTTWVGEVYLRYDAPASAKNSNDMTGQVGRVGSLALIGFSIITFIMSVLLPFIVKSPEGEEPAFTARPPVKLATFVQKAGQFKPSLLTAWMVSHVVFACAMCLAPFVESLRGATLIIGICGMYVVYRLLLKRAIKANDKQFLGNQLLGAFCLPRRRNQPPLINTLLRTPWPKLRRARWTFYPALGPAGY
jgi:hypothetical protein